MKKISIVGIAGIPACYGGFETLVENLTQYSSGRVSYTVFCSGKIYAERLKEHNGANLKYINLHANGMQSIPYDIISLFQSRKSDVILILGVSGCIALPLIRMISKAKIITNIDGLEWKRNKWNAAIKFFLKFSERMAVKFSDVVIADNYQITKYVKESYDVNAETIAYGGDHVLTGGEIGISSNYYLSLCRIEPENNVEMILETFSRTQKNLKFVGNWNSSDFGKRMIKKYSEFTNIEMIAPVYNLDELFVLRSKCKGYVHGHSAGGTNPSLVEIMHFAKPVFAFDCSFNRYTTDNRAIYFADTVDLVDKLTDEELLSAEMQECALSMQEIARTRYTWKTIAESYEALY
ncbi:hypothetical protein D3C75_222890 [compost metagenome]|uniref:DUF1972 domain-containing protein n=1 Tax=Silvania hatchlandensis TaxID=2926469 RepID=A0A9J6PW49_9ENTR|nr:DUF1972 domain-containing protein [Silvania hatchlandensis]MCU6664559.1 DUF1972 domain-containing protein [Silvania hatchlandensis]